MFRRFTQHIRQRQLNRRGDGEGQILVHLAQFGADNRRCDAISHAPAGHVVSLAERRYGNGALTQLRMSQHAGVTFRRKTNVLVHFIAQHENVFIRNDLPKLPDVTVAPDGSRRVMRRVDDHKLCAVGNLIGEFRPVHFEFRWLQLNAFHHAACQFYRRGVTVIARVESNHFVAFRHQRGDGDIQRFCRARRDGDVGVGVRCIAVNLFGFGGNRFT
ncbi:hypothetical protein SRABI106_03538 [Rahnella aquatilis]|nr:hypothetical protein SRABI106_03538 [Rahnella aquatilis]